MEIHTTIPANIVDGDVFIETVRGTSNAVPFTLGSTTTPNTHTVGNTWETTFSGTLTKDTVWRDNILLTGDVTISAGTVLTIEPGVTVFFAAHVDEQAGGHWTDKVELQVYGTLIAEGTPAQPIIFTSNAAQKKPEDWGGITVRKGSTNASLQYCVVQYADIGVYFRSFIEGTATLTGNIRNCTLTHNAAAIALAGRPDLARNDYVSCANTSFRL
jgi:hypothetical protein